MLRGFIPAVLASALVAASACAQSADQKAEAVEVELATALGNIVVEVYPRIAPLSAGDFLRYVDQGLYDDAGFYRVVRPDNDNGSPVISVIQGGLLEGQEGLAPVAHETTEATGLRHVDGALSLARSDPGTGSAGAFFIVLGEQPSLDYGGMRNRDGQGFAVFGRVVEGMDVVRRINDMKADAKAEDEYVSGQILAEPVRFKATRKPMTDTSASLVEEGRRLFFSETFDGNGRTCSTCHRREANFTIDPVFIATLPPTDPLFVAEYDPVLGRNLERPDLMRQFGLILANTDGFDDLERGHVMRSPQHLFALRTSVENYKGPHTGWGGDGAPGDATLRSFAIGAVRQHMPKTLARQLGVDFRFPTARELDALEAFVLSLGRQEDWTLPLPLRSPVVQRGQELFLDPQMKDGRCNLCHFNAGATAISASDYPKLVHIGNNLFSTGEDQLPGEPATLLPPDDGFADTRNFNTPPLIEAADTGPYFHNNAVQSIEEAIASYNDESFAQSITGIALEKRFGTRTDLDATEVLAIGAFLRVLNALENIRQSHGYLGEALQVDARDRERATWLIEQAGYETADAERVLAGINLHPAAIARLREAREWQLQAVSPGDTRDELLDRALAAHEAARADLVESWPPRPARYTIQPPTP